MISLVWILSLDDFPIIITSLFSVSDYNHSIYLFKCAVVHQFIRFWCVGSRSLFTSFSCFHVAFFLNFTLLNESFSWIKAAHSIDHARVDLCLSGGGWHIRWDSWAFISCVIRHLPITIPTLLETAPSIYLYCTVYT